MLRTLVEDQEIDAAEDFDLSVQVFISGKNRTCNFPFFVKRLLALIRKTLRSVRILAR